MKTVELVTRHGKFKVILAVKGPRGSTREALLNAANMAANRLERAERRFTLLRERRNAPKPKARKQKRKN